MTIWHGETDHIFETGVLLFCGFNKAHAQEYIRAEMTRYGINGTALDAKYNKIYTCYLDMFQKGRLYTGHEAFFLSDNNQEFFGLMFRPFLMDKLLCSLAEKRSSEELLRLLYRGLASVTGIDLEPYEQGTLAGQLQRIEKMSLLDQTKWKLFLVGQNPCAYFSAFAELLRLNSPVTAKAMESVRSRYRKQMPRAVSGPQDPVGRFEGHKMEPVEIYPSLAQPFSRTFVDNTCYYGLFWNELMQELDMQEDPAKLLSARLRALSDRNKLEMLLLCRKPCYNLEIANQMGLTTATVNYHMDALLSCGLVKMERRSKRAYYSIVNEAIDWIKQELDFVFDYEDGVRPGNPEDEERESPC